MLARLFSLCAINVFFCRFMTFRNLLPKDVEALKRACAGDQATPGIIEALCSSESSREVRKVRHYVVCSISVRLLVNWNLRGEGTYSSSCPTENSEQTMYKIIVYSFERQDTIFEYSVPHHTYGPTRAIRRRICRMISLGWCIDESALDTGYIVCSSIFF